MKLRDALFAIKKVFCVRRFVCFCHRKWIHNVLFHLQTISVIRLNWLSLFHSQGYLFFRRSNSRTSKYLFVMWCQTSIFSSTQWQHLLSLFSSRVMKYLWLFRQTSSLLLILTLFSSRLSFLWHTGSLFIFSFETTGKLFSSQIQLHLFSFSVFDDVFSLWFSVKCLS